MGSIGVGGMGTNNMRAFLNQDDVQVVAVCDVVKASNEYGQRKSDGEVTMSEAYRARSAQADLGPLASKRGGCGAVTSQRGLAQRGG